MLIHLDVGGADRVPVPAVREARGLALHRTYTDGGEASRETAFTVSHVPTGFRVCSGPLRQCERALKVLASLDWGFPTPEGVTEAHKSLALQVTLAMRGCREWPTHG